MCGILFTSFASLLVQSAGFSLSSLKLIDLFPTVWVNYTQAAREYLNRVVAPYEVDSRSYKKFGLKLSNAATTINNVPTDELKVGPFGFGYIRIPREVINEGLMKDNFFVIKVEKSDDVEFIPLPGEREEEDQSSLGDFNVIRRGGSMFLQFRTSTEFGDPIPVAYDGYFGVVNKSNKERSFKVIDTEKVCLSQSHAYSETKKECGEIVSKPGDLVCVHQGYDGDEVGHNFYYNAYWSTCINALPENCGWKYSESPSVYVRLDNPGGIYPETIEVTHSVVWNNYELGKDVIHTDSCTVSFP